MTTKEKRQAEAEALADWAPTEQVARDYAEALAFREERLYERDIREARAALTAGPRMPDSR